MQLSSILAGIFLLLGVPSTATRIFREEGLLADDLYQEGDVLLAGMFSLNRNAPGVVCGGDISYTAIQGSQSMIYKINEINKRRDLLPNITLGFVLLNDCSNDMSAIARATQLIPINDCWTDECNSRKASGTSKNTQNGTYSGQYKVAGVVGPWSSSLSTAVSPLLSFYKIPHISWISTSDDLLIHATTKYPYFSRVVPADRFQARALVDVLSHYNWTYISVIYTAGSYGSNGLREVSKEARKNGICIAHVEGIDNDFDEDDFDGVVRNLVKNERAKVVVLFVFTSHGRKIFEAIDRAHLAGKFIFITSEGFNAGIVRSMKQHASNLLHLLIPGGPFRDIPWGDKGFVKYYHSLNPWNNATGIKWYGQYFPHKVGCSFEVDEGDVNWCGQYKNISDFKNFKINNWPARIVDIVEIYAQALNATINEKCPEAFSNKSYLKGCIDGETLNKNIRSVSFVGKSVIVRFDENGELLSSRYMLMAHDNRNEYVYQGVGLWDNEKREIDFFEDKVIPWFDFVNGSLVEVPQPPESVCAKPCLPGEFLLQGDLACCWECHRCMVDEIVSADGKACVRCNVTTWPDEQLTSCILIPPRYIKWTDGTSMILLSITFVAFLVTFLMAIVFIVKREMKIIKGSNRELMTPIFVGILLAYLVVLTFILRPSNLVCYVSLIGYHLSCSLIFVPLFLKTLRVYLIFRAAEKLSTTVPLANLKILLGCFFVLILCQVMYE